MSASRFVLFGASSHDFLAPHVGPYWIQVKNSWGGDWGMKGYILLKREAPQHGGECGILMQASYPVLA